MDINTLNILSDAISEVGAWHWWDAKDDTVLMQFCDVLLYDEAKPEKDTHTTDVLAIRFRGRAFALFMDNMDDDNWHKRLRDDGAVVYPVDTYALAFDDRDGAEALLKDYKNKIPVKDRIGGGTLPPADHLLFAGCGDVGFIVGGDEMAVIGEKELYTEEEIVISSGKWWDYWKAYWKKRGTKDAYPKDYACEITIPVRED